RLVEDVQPDVIHHHNISLLGRGVVSKGQADRTLYTAHDYWLRCPRSDLYKYGRYPCDAPTCGRCALVSRRIPQPWRYSRGWKGLEGLDWVIAPSAFMRAAIEGEVACPVAVIPNFAPDPNPGVRIFPPDEYYLYVGVYEPHKGLPELVSAIEAFEGGARFVFVGRGSLERRLRKLAGRRDDVDVMGWLQSSRLGPFYRGARGLILPSQSYENSPLSAIEALSWGTPLLVSKRGGLEELVQEGAGLAVEPTTAALRAGLDRFEADGMPESSRQPARSTYEARHHPVRYLERYMTLIEEERDEAIEKMSEGTVAAGSPDSKAP
ncbi:MAG: glycosyltransferase, partial [Nitrospinota bacterium]